LKPSFAAAAAVAGIALCAVAGRAAAQSDTFTIGHPEIRSMSALAFGPPGVLFVGDGRGGAVFALDLGTRTAQAATEPPEIRDIEGRIAARLGTTPGEIMIHDMAVDSTSRNVYLSVSRGRDRRWNFTPDRPWSAGGHVVRVDPALEDLAGNSVGGAFERQEDRAPGPRLAPVEIPFRVGPG
jgi:hypothetical protein